MSQPMPDAENRVEMSSSLRATLQRAGRYAAEQMHRHVTIEHILLALNEDSDAEIMLQTCAIDQGRLHADVSQYLGLLEDRVGPGEQAQPVLDPEAARIVNSAVIAAQKSRRREVNGAIVLAAIIGDGRTPAANMLRSQGLTFQAAIEALQTAQAPSQPRAPEPAAVQPLPHMQQPQPQPPANQNPPQPQTDYMMNGAGAAPADQQPDGQHTRTPDADDVLAAARRRIEAQRAAAERLRAETQAEREASQPPRHDQPLQEQYRPAPPAAEPPPQQPRPLQTADSLARYERRPPPAIPAPSADEYHADAGEGRSRAAEPASAPPGAPPPVPPGPSEQSPPPAYQEYRADLATENAAEPLPDAAPQRPAPPPPLAPAAGHPPPNFGGDPLRRPPPPEAMQPPQPAYEQAGHYQPAPPQPASYERTAGRTGYDATDRQAHPPAARDYRHEQQRAPAAPHAGGYGGGYSDSGNLPVPVPSEQRSSLAVRAGQLIENIPRRMRNGVAELVEVRIARAEIQNLATGMQGAGEAHHHDLVATKAMSVRLRAPDGGFFVETASPETQWIENHLGVLSDDYASWRWTVTPNRAGRARLQLIVSARTIGSDGLVAETALPDQVFEVRVSTNYGRLAKHWFGWVAAAILGGLLAKFGEDAFAIAQMIIRSNMGG
jgi:hypothetical protein